MVRIPDHLEGNSMARRKTSRKPAASAAPALTFNHAMIYVQNVEPAVAFYSALGFRTIEHWPGYARLRAPRGNSTIALHQIGGSVTSVAAEGIRLYFEVKNLDAFCARLAASGIAFTQMPKVMPWG
jgi:catechol 2,3-dioxygenase-like lactoylglutathione lyase family enzyme